MFKRVAKEHLELVCPDCDKNTKIKTQDGVQCFHCEVSFKGFTFKKKKFLTKAFAIATVSAAIGGSMIDFDDERLPYEAEYRLMTSCIQGKGKILNSGIWGNQIDQCACAIRKSVNNLGVARNRNEADEVLGAFGADVQSEMAGCD